MEEFYVTHWSFGIRNHWGITPPVSDRKVLCYMIEVKLGNLFREWEQNADTNTAGVIADCMSDCVPEFADSDHEKMWFALRDWMALMFSDKSVRLYSWQTHYFKFLPDKKSVT